MDILKNLLFSTVSSPVLVPQALTTTEDIATESTPPRMDEESFPPLQAATPATATLRDLAAAAVSNTHHMEVCEAADDGDDNKDGAQPDATHKMETESSDGAPAPHKPAAGNVSDEQGRIDADTFMTRCIASMEEKKRTDFPFFVITNGLSTTAAVAKTAIEIRSLFEFDRHTHHRDVAVYHTETAFAKENRFEIAPHNELHVTHTNNFDILSIGLHVHKPQLVVMHTDSDNIRIKVGEAIRDIYVRNDTLVSIIVSTSATPTRALLDDTLPPSLRHLHLTEDMFHVIDCSNPEEDDDGHEDGEEAKIDDLEGEEESVDAGKQMEEDRAEPEQMEEDDSNTERESGAEATDDGKGETEDEQQRDGQPAGNEQSKGAAGHGEEEYAGHENVQKRGSDEWAGEDAPGSEGLEMDDYNSSATDLLNYNWKRNAVPSAPVGTENVQPICYMPPPTVPQHGQVGYMPPPTVPQHGQVGYMPPPTVPQQGQVGYMPPPTVPQQGQVGYMPPPTVPQYGQYFSMPPPAAPQFGPAAYTPPGTMQAIFFPYTVNATQLPSAIPKNMTPPGQTAKTPAASKVPEVRARQKQATPASSPADDRSKSASRTKKPHAGTSKCTKTPQRTGQKPWKK